MTLKHTAVTVLNVLQNRARQLSISYALNAIDCCKTFGDFHGVGQKRTNKMPLRIEAEPKGRININFHCGVWTITPYFDGVVTRIYKTHMDKLIWSQEFDPPLNIHRGEPFIVSVNDSLAVLSP